MKLRDVLLPRWHREEAPGGPSAPPWHQPGPLRAVTLESHRFEHAGAHHRLQLREHADGSALVVVDAQRIARLTAQGLADMRRFIASGMKDAATFERATWGEPVLTGAGPVMVANAWRRAQGSPVPEIPLVATLEIAGDAADRAAARVRRLQEMAIPHVVIRPSGEDAARATIAAVRAAEDVGLVTGVAAPADFLDDGDALDELAQAGLDHLALMLAGPDAASHDAVLGAGEHAKLVRVCEGSARRQVPITGEIPLVDANWARVGDILRAAPPLGMLGVTSWALAGDAQGAIPRDALRQVAVTLEHAADEVSLPVTWAAPVRAVDVRRDVLRGPRTDGDFGVRIAADGSVLPPRASGEPAGNLDAAEHWDEIAQSPAWQAFARRAAGPTRCDACPGLASCVVDCPASAEGWA